MKKRNSILASLLILLALLSASPAVCASGAGDPQGAFSSENGVSLTALNPDPDEATDQNPGQNTPLPLCG